MSKAIVAEALWRVTQWGVGGWLGHPHGGPATKPAP